MNIRFFCQTYPHIEGIDRTWSDVSYIYLQALLQVPSLTIQAVPQKGFTWSAMRNDRWSPLKNTFYPPQSLPEPYTNIVVGDQATVDHYWTAGCKNIAITTLEHVPSEIFQKFDQVWVPTFDEWWQTAQLIAKPQIPCEGIEGPLITHIDAIPGLLRAALAG